jgi:hypothetical protein
LSGVVDDFLTKGHALWLSDQFQVPSTMRLRRSGDDVWSRLARHGGQRQSLTQILHAGVTA